MSTITVCYQGPPILEPLVRYFEFVIFDRVDQIQVRDCSHLNSEHLSNLKYLKRIEIWGDPRDCAVWLKSVIPTERLRRIDPINGGVAAILQ